jgi:F0F1-type ATP synthase epsilon subunit
MPEKTFQCVVIAPPGRMLDCTTTSVVLPAHDGHIGVWHNHMPMFCKLGLGILKATPVTEDEIRPHSDIFLLIDRGFVLVSSNIVTVIAYDAVSFRDVRAERIDQILQKAKKKLSTVIASPQQREYEARRFALMTRLAQVYGGSATKVAQSQPLEGMEVLQT